MWVPLAADGDVSCDWERAATIQLRSIAVEDLTVVQAAVERVREIAPTFWRRLRDWWSGDESTDRYLPNGGSGKSISRRRDALLVLGSQAIDPAVLQRHWPLNERLLQIGPALWMVVGYRIATDDRIIASQTLQTFDETIAEIPLAKRGRDSSSGQNPTGGKTVSPETPADRSGSSAGEVDAARLGHLPESGSAVSPAMAPLKEPRTLDPPAGCASSANAPGRGVQPRSPDREVRVFLSSTNRDMKAERDHLTDEVFPLLRKLCESRGVSWGVVDYRWGITDDEKADKQVIPICLREISRCRYFIGILGERYGWIPDADDFTPWLLAQHPWLEEHRGRSSVTELEILHGVVRQTPGGKRAFVYFRDHGHLDRLPADCQRADFECESEEADTRLKRLKTQLKESRQEGRCQLRESPYRSVEELGTWVLEDFRTLIDALFPEDRQPGPDERDADEHVAHAEALAEVYVRRQEHFRQIDGHLANHRHPLAVLGESGIGKSALLANYLLDYHRRQPTDLAIIHFAGRTPQSADESVMLRRVLAEMKRHYGWSDDVPISPDELRNSFRHWLARASRSGGVLLILDAVNQLQADEKLPALGWLPSDLPANCRVILSTLPGRYEDTVRRHSWPTLTISALTQAERRNLLQEYLKQDARHLAGTLVEEIVAAERTGNPLFLRAILDELRSFGEHEQLSGRIREYLAADDPGALYTVLLQHWQQRFGTQLVRSSLSLVAAARRGLSETEIVELLGGGRESRVAWTPFFISTDSIYVWRDGLLTFSHDYIRTAVEGTFLEAPADRRRVHSMLAGYFEKRRLRYSTDRILDELPWHCQQAGHWGLLKDLLTDRNIFVRFRSTERGKMELQRYWMCLEKFFDPCQVYRQAVERWEQNAMDANSFLEALTDLGRFHNERAEFDAAEPLFRRVLADREAAYGAHHSVAAAMNNLASLLNDTNRLAEAEFLLRRALKIDERVLGPEHPKTFISVHNLANVLSNKGDYAGAEPLYRRALETSERVLGPEHPETLRSVNNLAGLLHSKGDYAAAEPLLRRALQGLLKISALMQQAHPNLQAFIGNYAACLEQQGREPEEIRNTLKALLPPFGMTLAGDAPGACGSTSISEARNPGSDSACESSK